MTSKDNNIKEFVSGLCRYEFAKIPAIWNSFSEEEKIFLKNIISTTLSESDIIEIYENFCLISERLANEIFDVSLLKINYSKKQINEGILESNYEFLILEKINYLQAFREKLIEKGFPDYSVSLLLSQELGYINNLILERAKGDGTK